MPRSFPTLDTRDLPDPELMIRTSGEHRISNFLAVANGLHGVLFFTGFGRILARKNSWVPFGIFKTGNARFGGCWTPTTTLNRNEEDRKSRACCSAAPCSWCVRHRWRGLKFRMRRITTRSTPLLDCRCPGRIAPSAQAVKLFSALQLGQELTIPGEEMTSCHSVLGQNLWARRHFHRTGRSSRQRGLLVAIRVDVSPPPA